ncbi:MAG: SH3 domain-containing protein, partial [Steroidobacteraceae bacterium]
MLRVLAGLTLCAFAAAAHAAVQYVVEQVVVSVSSSPDGAGEHLATIKSGDPVELLERQGEEAHIRVASGQEGWVRASYLSAEPPLRAQLTERSAQVAALTQEV